jgi:hypothetical protein
VGFVTRGFRTAGFFAGGFARDNGFFFGTLTGPLFEGGRSPLDRHTGLFGSFLTVEKIVAN